MTTSTTSTDLTAETIAKFEAAGFRRWTKGRFDRLYINTKLLGLEVEYYNTGNVRNATWCGESISNSDGRRFLASKVFVDVKTGELSVKDCTNLNYEYYGMPSIEDRAREVVDAILAPEPEPEPEVEVKPETTDESTDEQAQADADFIEFLKTGGKFDADAEDGHFTIEGREYEVTSDADGETTIERVDGKPFQHSELDAYLGDFDRDFDTDAIIDEVTYVDANGTRRWLNLDLVEFAAIVESHELRKSYQVIIEDADESCDEVLLDETFADADAAKARFAELRAEFADENGGWRDGLNLWLFEDGESVDGESK